MKINIEIDCTPDEARDFFGLPDVKPMQEALLSEISARLKKGLDHTDPETLMKTWFAPGMESMAQFQKTLWSAAMGAGLNPSKDD